MVLDSALRKVDWSGTGIRINGQQLTHILFADDCLLFAKNRASLKTMMEKFSTACDKVGLKINPKKSEYMNNQNEATPLKFQGCEIPPKSDVKYLGANISIGGDWTKRNQRKNSVRVGRVQYLPKYPEGKIVHDEHEAEVVQHHHSTTFDLRL